MQLSQAQLEWIVTEVVRRLRVELTATENGASCTCQAPTKTSQLRLDDRVITTETLRSQLADVAEVEIPGRAIVTPAAIDLLNDNNIVMRRSANR